MTPPPANSSTEHVTDCDRLDEPRVGSDCTRHRPAPPLRITQYRQFSPSLVSTPRQRHHTIPALSPRGGDSGQARSACAFSHPHPKEKLKLLRSFSDTSLNHKIMARALKRTVAGAVPEVCGVSRKVTVLSPPPCSSARQVRTQE